jgi:hypothetical protein
VLLIATALPVSAQKEVTVDSTGDTSLAIQSGSSKVRVTISTHEVQNGTPSKPVKPKHSSCTMSRMPCSVVDQISVTVSGKPLFVPRSVYCDLADLGGASLKASGRGWSLTLVGGDASESYQLVVDFNSQSINHRTLTALEAGEKTQETNYYQVVLE